MTASVLDPNDFCALVDLVIPSDSTLASREAIMSFVGPASSIAELLPGSILRGEHSDILTLCRWVSTGHGASKGSDSCCYL